jgi:hypothetical protein
LEEALKQFHHLKDKLGVAQCLRSLGENPYRQMNYPQAQIQLQNALIQFEQMKDQVGIACCLKSLGETLYK